MQVRPGTLPPGSIHPPYLTGSLVSRFLCNTALLCLALALPTAHSQSVPANVLFNDPPPAEGGWKGLARLLEALSPGVDTNLPLTPSAISDRIATMLNEGRNQEALDVIDQYAKIREDHGTLGSDVQLLFQKGRALAALGRSDEAIALYQDMTVRFPELPEPWNNLAAEYVKKGHLDLARDALQMALTTDPKYLAAQINQGRVYLLLSRQSFSQAAQQGQPQAADTVKRLDAILQGR